MLKYKLMGKYVNILWMLFGNGWDYGIGFVVFEVYNGNYVYICMFYNGEDVEYRDVKGKMLF